MGGQRKNNGNDKKGGGSVQAYNPLTGNRRFFNKLEDGHVPDENRTVEPPAYDDQGQVFKPRQPRRDGASR